MDPSKSPSCVVNFRSGSSMAFPSLLITWVDKEPQMMRLKRTHSFLIIQLRREASEDSQAK
jgi:hypothetical protein